MLSNHTVAKAKKVYHQWMEMARHEVLISPMISYFFQINEIYT